MTKHRNVLCSLKAHVDVSGGCLHTSATVGYYSHDADQSESYARQALKDGREHVTELTRLLDELSAALEPVK